MQPRIKVLGVNDDRDTCQCCGKEGLKRVVWLAIDDSEPVHYGTTCAAKVAGISGRWTSNRADALAEQLRKREERMARYAALADHAQAMANETKQPVHIGYTGVAWNVAPGLSVFTEAQRLETIQNPNRYADIQRTFMPGVAA